MKNKYRFYISKISDQIIRFEIESGGISDSVSHVFVISPADLHHLKSCIIALEVQEDTENGI